MVRKATAMFRRHELMGMGEKCFTRVCIYKFESHMGLLWRNPSHLTYNSTETMRSCTTGQAGTFSMGGGRGSFNSIRTHHSI
jgi:hypothetical protein